MNKAFLAATSLMTLVLAACAQWEGVVSQSAMTDANTLKIAATTDGVPTSSPWPATDWWRDYRDEQLDQLISEGLNGSPALKVAAARIRRATATAGLIESGLYPRLNGSADSVYQRFTENGLYPPPFAGEVRTTNRLALDGLYSFDFWGGREAEFRSALGTQHANEVDGEAARWDLTAAIAQAYARLAGEFDQLDIGNDQLRQKKEIRTLSEKLVRAGLVTEVESQQAAAAIAATEAEISLTEERIALVKQRLSALVGSGPDRGQTIHRPRLALAPPAGLPSDLPAELIGRRPDIVAQRWRIEAAAKAVDAGQAAFYPNVNLSAMFGFQSIGAEQVLRAGSLIGGIGPAISLPIFDAGRLRNTLAQADADLDMFVEQYNGAVAGAVQDVVGQLTSWRFNQAALERESVALSHLEKAYRLAVLRYREGLISYLTVLSAEGELIAHRRKEAESRNRQFVISIALIHALGGGFAPRSIPPS